MSSSLGRNDPCHCGSGEKYKHCCLEKDRPTTTVTSNTVMIVIAVLILVGLVALGISVFTGDGQDRCPPGTVWSAAHQHCH